MSLYKFTQEAEIEITAKDIANLFCDLDNEQQAEFFNQISENVSKWDHAFCFQLQEVLSCKKLTDAGKKIMSEIGEYSH